MVQSLYKTDSWFKKSHEEFRQTLESPDKHCKLLTSSGKSKNLKFDGLLLSKKYISSAKTLDTEDLSNINLNSFCENSSNSLCHFWNHKSFFTTQLLCICLSQALRTFYKSSPSKYKFSDLPLLALKFIKFLIFGSKSQVFFKVCITL